MTYLPRHNKKIGEKARLLISVGAILIFIFVLIQIFIPRFFPSIFSSIAEPFWKLEFSAQNNGFSSVESILRENIDLRLKLADLQVQYQSLSAIETENSELKAFFNRASSTSYVLSAILAKPPFAPYDEFIIDIGKDHKLSTSSLVYAPGRVLIGKVYEVFGQTARVKLFTSPGQKYAVSIGPKRYSATAIGRGGGQYQAELSRDVVVDEGDFVSSLNLNERVFGIVTKVLSDPTQPFETVLFAPPVNIYDLRWVLVDVKGKVL